MICKIDGCGRPTRSRHLCCTHYARFLIRKNEWRGRRPSEPIREYHVNYNKRSCVCDDSKPTVLAWFSRRVLDVEPQPGSIVECASCGLPIEAYLDVSS